MKVNEEEVKTTEGGGQYFDVIICRNLVHTFSSQCLSSANDIRGN